MWISPHLLLLIWQDTPSPYKVVAGHKCGPWPHSTHSPPGSFRCKLGPPPLVSSCAVDRLSDALLSFPCLSPAQMTGYPMLLTNTLLGRCIARNAGMWITDCTLYMQVCCCTHFECMCVVRSLANTVCSGSFVCAFVCLGVPHFDILFLTAAPSLHRRTATSPQKTYSLAATLGT